MTTKERQLLLPGIGPARERFEARFWAKVNKTQTCWFWTGAKNSDGYGNLGIGSRTDGSRRTVRAHRVSYLLAGFVVPEGKELDHVCRNPSCVKPSHLEAILHSENIRRGHAWVHWAQRQRAKNTLSPRTSIRLVEYCFPPRR